MGLTSVRQALRAKARVSERCALLLPVLFTSCILPAECPLPDQAAPVTSATGDLYMGSGDPYVRGILDVQHIDVAVCEQGAPAAMRVFGPTHPGRYAVVVFQHGFFSRGVWYGEILEHLASHGFVVVAPQMYSVDGLPTRVPSTDEEIGLAIRILDWLPKRLGVLSGVQADMTNLGMAGHSRGGKVAWGVLFQQPWRARAVAGLDPVDGSRFNQSRVVQGPFNFPFPSLVLGTGRGGSCAPAGDNHVQFYTASASPAWHTVGVTAGHSDFYDSDCSNCLLPKLVCERGDDPAGTRRLAAGQLSAFFRAALQGDATAYQSLTGTAAPIPTAVESK